MRPILSKVIPAIVFFASLLSGCILAQTANIRGSGSVEEEIRPVGEFNTVELHTIADVFIQFSDSFLVRVKAEDNLLPYIQTRVESNSLIIDLKEGTTLIPQEPILVYVSLPSLIEIRSSSTGDMTIDPFSTENFTASLSSTGDVRMEGLQAESVNLRTSSAGDITILSLRTNLLEAHLSSTGDITIQEGTTQWQSIRISSTGDYKAANLLSSDAELVLSSTGNAVIQVSDTLKARLSGTGDLAYIGSPSLDIKNSGGGDVKPRDQE
ncbi:MAG: DUF2807 domain-containing protein [Anaerolineales bacterium]|nr:DUF2807 domain-containing protein [Anaerolineales bacterium]